MTFPAADAPVLVWLRRDLRLDDNPALAAAQGSPVLPVFVLDETTPRPPGGTSRWWLHHSLNALQADIAAKGGRLLLLKGRALDEIPRLAAELGAEAVHWNRRHEPGEAERERVLAAKLRENGIAARTFAPDLLFEPGTLSTKTGGPFQVFTPFWRAALNAPPPAPPQPAPLSLPAPVGAPEGLPLDALELMPRIAWWHGMAEEWEPGEPGASERLVDFLDHDLHAYDQRRDIPGIEGTSRLSPHLAFGEIGPRRIWHSVRARQQSNGSETFLKELGWRDFCYGLAATYPDLTTTPLRGEFADFPWIEDRDAFAAWTQGRTGYPIVDAGMRQLWHTGWMHNRVRMIVGSFLVKDLLLPWQQGEAWFWDTLVDADPAVNAASWQWVSGCGADAAPYFRVFNPVLQGEKFDPTGEYVRRWVPELGGLPDAHIHRPWEAPPLILAGAKVKPGITYPDRMVDHAAARDRALAAYARIKGTR